MLKVNTGGKRNERSLTENELKEVFDFAVQLGMPRDQVYYVDYDCTAYGEAFDILRIGTDVFPLNEKTKNVSPNSKVSMRAAIAHEVIGHREAALKKETCDDELLEEVQASIRAARFSPFLSKSDRLTLLRDALYRLRQNDRKLKNVRAFLHINER